MKMFKCFDNELDYLVFNLKCLFVFVKFPYWYSQENGVDVKSTYYIFMEIFHTAYFLVWILIAYCAVRGVVFASFIGAVSTPIYAIVVATSSILVTFVVCNSLKPLKNIVHKLTAYLSMGKFVAQEKSSTWKSIQSVWIVSTIAFAFSLIPTASHDDYITSMWIDLYRVSWQSTLISTHISLCTIIHGVLEASLSPLFKCSTILKIKEVQADCRRILKIHKSISSLFSVPILCALIIHVCYVVVKLYMIINTKNELTFLWSSTVCSMIYSLVALVRITENGQCHADKVGIHPIFQSPIHSLIFKELR